MVVSRELDKKEYIWLTALTSDLTMEDAKAIIIEASRLSDKDDMEFSESVLQVVLSKNPTAFAKVKEVPEVCEALSKLMKPEMDELKEKLNETEAALASEREKNQAAENRIKELEAKLALERDY